MFGCNHEALLYGTCIMIYGKVYGLQDDGLWFKIRVVADKNGRFDQRLEITSSHNIRLAQPHQD